MSELDIVTGDGLVLAFDGDRRPWVGLSRQKGAPIFIYDDGGTATRKALHMHLEQCVSEDDRRLYLAGVTEEVEHDGETILMYRLLRTDE